MDLQKGIPQREKGEENRETNKNTELG